MSSGSPQLREYPTDTVRLSCAKCGRSGQYRKQNLIEKYGADIPLPDLREQIAKCRHRGMHDACMVRYVECACCLHPSVSAKRRQAEMGETRRVGTTQVNYTPLCTRASRVIESTFG